MTVLIGLLISAVLAILSWLGVAKVSQSSGITNVAIGLGAWFFWLVLVITPVKMWKMKRDRVVELEASRKPCLQVCDIVENDKGEAGTGWAIKVYNSGVSPADRCHGRLEELDFETPRQNQTLERIPTSRDLHWSGQREDGDYDIPGLNYGNLNVIYCEDRTIGRPIMLAYRDTEQFQLENVLSGLRDTILVLVNITCAGKVPIYVLCRAELNIVASGIVQGYVERPAVSIVYQGPERPDIVKYQRQTNPPLNGLVSSI